MRIDDLKAESDKLKELSYRERMFERTKREWCHTDLEVAITQEAPTSQATRKDGRRWVG